jgi:hypothetical protein
MSKGTFSAGQPIFSQVLSYVSKTGIDRIAEDFQADHACRYFTTYNHLVTMLYAVFNKCSSIREVITGLMAWEHRINHLGIDIAPKRSTLSDANARRSEEVFGKIYEHLYAKHRHFLPDSRKKKTSKLFIADSTTISLFQEVMRSAGRNPLNGKRKGGVKVHTLVQSDEDVPCLIRFSSGAGHDSPFLKDIKLPDGSLIVFDKGYNDYSQFQRFSDEKVSWITRKRKNAVHKTLEKRTVSQAQSVKGVKKDRLILLGNSQNPKTTLIKARLIDFVDLESGKKFQFLTNNTHLSAASIAALYRKRWQIEILFKRFKQNYPLKYFLGDNENAIKIQIWCALISDLLIKIIKSLAGRKWSFSNLASLVRIHLMTYIDLFTFLTNPESALKTKSPNKSYQGSLFPT